LEDVMTDLRKTDPRVAENDQVRAARAQIEMMESRVMADEVRAAQTVRDTQSRAEEARRRAKEIVAPALSPADTLGGTALKSFARELTEKYEGQLSALGSSKGDSGSTNEEMDEDITMGEVEEITEPAGRQRGGSRKGHTPRMSVRSNVGTSQVESGGPEEDEDEDDEETSPGPAVLPVPLPGRESVSVPW
jgi:hypothetical protein